MFNSEADIPTFISKYKLLTVTEMNVEIYTRFLVVKDSKGLRVEHRMHGLRPGQQRMRAKRSLESFKAVML